MKPLKKLEKTIAAVRVMAATATQLEVDALARVGHREQAHLHRHGGQPQSDDDDDRADERRRQQLAQPAGAEGLHDAGDDHVDDACSDEAAECRRDVVAAGTATDGDERRDEGEARSQVARDLVAHADEIDDRADARGHEAHAGVESGQNRHEHGRAEHRHQMLQRQAVSRAKAVESRRSVRPSGPLPSRPPNRRASGWRA